jgi:hypothetical protein
MEWSGRAPAPPAMNAGRGPRRQGARHATETRHFARRNRVIFDRIHGHDLPFDVCFVPLNR